MKRAVRSAIIMQQDSVNSASGAVDKNPQLERRGESTKGKMWKATEAEEPREP